MVSKLSQNICPGNFSGELTNECLVILWINLKIYGSCPVKTDQKYRICRELTVEIKIY